MNVLYFLTGSNDISGVVNSIFHEKETVEINVNFNRHL